MLFDPPFDPGPYTIHTPEPPPPYRPGPDRWNVYDTSLRRPNESEEEFRMRGLLSAIQWASEDDAAPVVAQQPAAKRGRGRPPVYPVVPGETPAERRLRLRKLRAGDTADAVHKLSTAKLVELAALFWWDGATRADQGPPTKERVEEWLSRQSQLQVSA